MILTNKLKLCVVAIQCKKNVFAYKNYAIGGMFSKLVCYLSYVQKHAAPILDYIILQTALLAIAYVQTQNSSSKKLFLLA